MHVRAVKFSQKPFALPQSEIWHPLCARHDPPSHGCLPHFLNARQLVVSHALVVTPKELKRVAGKRAEEDLARQPMPRHVGIQAKQPKRLSDQSQAIVRPLSVVVRIGVGITLPD